MARSLFNNIRSSRTFVRSIDRAKSSLAERTATGKPSWTQTPVGLFRPTVIANSISSLIESILLQASEPLNAQQISKHTGKLSAKEVVDAIDNLKQQLHTRRSAYSVREVAGGFQLFSVEDVFEDLVHVGLTSGPMPLSPTQLETLAVIAYKQPIGRADIEAIRGVQCAEVIRQLLERGVVKIVGQEDTLGRPYLYGTTKKLLEELGLLSLDDLPKISGFMRQQEQAGK